MIKEPADLHLGDWSLKVRQPEGAGPYPVIFLIHGWTGDERSMWVFASRLPKESLLIAPRAPYISKHPEYGGFSWVQDRVGEFSALPAFGPALEQFSVLSEQLAQELPGDFARFGMVGFSQGAAFTFAYALSNPQRVDRLACLAGFLPEKSEAKVELDGLQGKPILIAHGIQDETVPIDRARQARDLLSQSGADVRYCESETGHKLGANCFSELADFFKD